MAMFDLDVGLCLLFMLIDKHDEHILLFCTYFLPEIQFIHASVLIVATVGDYINHCLCHLFTMLFEFGMLLMNHEFECCCCCYA
jgi:hypothetical protein